MRTELLWALLVALLAFLVILGLFCISAYAGGAVWGNTSFGFLFFIGCVVGCIIAITVFEGVAALFAVHAEKVYRDAKVQ